MGKYYSIFLFDTALIGADTVIIPITPTVATGGVRLRLVAVPNTAYTLAHVDKGVWGAGNIPDGVYTLQVDTGSGFINSPSFSDASGKWIGDEAYDASIITSGVFNIAQIPLITNAKLDSGIDAEKIGSGNITNGIFEFLIDVNASIQGQFDDLVTDIGTANTAIGLRALDADVIHKAGIEIFTGNKAIRSLFAVDIANGGKLQQIVYTPPTVDKDYVAKKYVDDEIVAYLTGVTVPYAQMSDRTRRVIYGGVFEGGRVELTINNAINNVIPLVPALDKQYYIYVEKNGEEATYGANASLTALADYVHIAGQNNGTVIFPADSIFSSGGIGRNIIKDCTLRWVAGATATPLFSEVIFQNVIFDIADNSLDLDSCDLIGCKLKRTSGTWTITNCTGTEIEADVLPTFTGYSPEIKLSNQYNQRRLGTLPVIASASTITLTYGNSFSISGTTTINAITTTGWTNGSIVALYFQGALTVTNGVTIATKSGSNITTSAGTTAQFILNGSTWYEI